MSGRRAQPRRLSLSVADSLGGLRNPRLLLAAAAALGLAGMASANAIANATKSGNAAMALAIRDDDSEALTLRAELLLAQSQRDRTNLARARAVAVRALEAQPLNGRALRIVGVADAVRGGPAAGMPIMDVAFRQNQRDLFTQLWMFGQAADRRDVAKALVHYDAAVRVTPESWNLVFPVLIRSLTDAGVARAFAPYMRSTNPWMGDFVRQAVRTSANPDAVALALAGGTLPDTAEMRSLEDELVAKLIAQGHFDAMRQLLAARSVDHGARTLRADLTPASFGRRYQPIHWLLDEANGASVDETLGPQRPRIRVEILRGVTGVVASKFLTLSPGTWRFTTRSSFARPVAQASFRWRLRCWTGDAYAIAWRSDPIVEPSQTVSAAINVPASCGGALLELEAVGPTYATDTEFMVDALSFARA